ncbi:TrmB family transcriptional regulator [Candidatus Woesearchaeota archaeon]|jgi:sugar-specific transcriptional regulator TrmB|nr:TrmB family transcriptional regulator [Candidatus Woesearchaeota archaeon]MBT4367757.1 TrmB family transcriptional regulator [Candidatus Woesearchaeota archaeon]MBT4712245.1 TrmB family transcriptional regulator [Candidatus Woesearchaeota archaeon]MBT6638793.1 TrmB family transcriptional regulator [Candidatus Woesearchaeota archaeon]MBT7134437.1 TrmB family transcriptional regulator [Candidatus Woesearchaeota archaeon]
MINRELLGKLKDFNLNTYESKIWLALLMKGSATAGNLSEITDVPRSRCYDVLESLEKKGFIVMKVGRPIKYIAVSPIEAIERTKQKLLLDANEKISIVENLKTSDVMNNLNELHNSGFKNIKPEELTSIIKSDKNIKNQISFMIKNADKVFLSTDNINLKNHFNTIKNLLKTSSRKPEIKIISNESSEVPSELSNIVTLKTVPNASNFCVTDKHAALFLTNNSSQNYVLWINSEYSVNTLRDLFETKWATA